MFEALSLQRTVPINIYNSKTSKKLAWLCDKDWELPSQIDELETWLKENGSSIEPSEYVADVGFDIRKNACGGGAVLGVEAMKTMSYLGMELFLSEYPDGENE